MASNFSKKLSLFLTKFSSPNYRNSFQVSLFSQDVPKGVVYDKKPVKVALEKGKTYFWCACGRSKNQPFCDGTHKKKELNIKQTPVKFEVTESKEYFLCNCKQTNKSPFCDGTHKQPKVQNAKSIK